MARGLEWGNLAKAPAEHWPWAVQYHALIRDSVEVSGIKNIPKGRAILAGNHVSSAGADGAILATEVGLRIGRVPVFVVQSERLSRLTRALARAAGSIVVKPHQTVPAMIRRLKKGDPVLMGIFPAGRPSKTPEKNVELFDNSAAAKVAWETRTPMVPFYVETTLRYNWSAWALLPKYLMEKARLKQKGSTGKTRIVFGPALDPADFGSSAELTQRLKEAVLELRGQSTGPAFAIKSAARLARKNEVWMRLRQKAAVLTAGLVLWLSGATSHLRAQQSVPVPAPAPAASVPAEERGIHPDHPLYMSADRRVTALFGMHDASQKNASQSYRAMIREAAAGSKKPPIVVFEMSPNVLWDMSRAAKSGLLPVGPLEQLAVYFESSEALARIKPILEDDWTKVDANLTAPGSDRNWLLFFAQSGSFDSGIAKEAQALGFTGRAEPITGEAWIQRQLGAEIYLRLAYSKLVTADPTAAYNAAARSELAIYRSAYLRDIRFAQFIEQLKKENPESSIVFHRGMSHRAGLQVLMGLAATGTDPLATAFSYASSLDEDLRAGRGIAVDDPRLAESFLSKILTSSLKSTVRHAEVKTQWHEVIRPMLERATAHPGGSKGAFEEVLRLTSEALGRLPADRRSEPILIETSLLESMTKAGLLPAPIFIEILEALKKRPQRSGARMAARDWTKDSRRLIRKKIETVVGRFHRVFYGKAIRVADIFSGLKRMISERSIRKILGSQGGVSTKTKRILDELAIYGRGWLSNARILAAAKHVHDQGGTVSTRSIAKVLMSDPRWDRESYRPRSIAAVTRAVHQRLNRSLKLRLNIGRLQGYVDRPLPLFNGARMTEENGVAVVDPLKEEDQRAVYYAMLRGSGILVESEDVEAKAEPVSNEVLEHVGQLLLYHVLLFSITGDWEAADSNDIFMHIKEDLEKVLDQRGFFRSGRSKAFQRSVLGSFADNIPINDKIWIDQVAVWCRDLKSGALVPPSVMPTPIDRFSFKFVNTGSDAAIEAAADLSKNMFMRVLFPLVAAGLSSPAWGLVNSVLVWTAAYGLWQYGSDLAVRRLSWIRTAKKKIETENIHQRMIHDYIMRVDRKTFRRDREEYLRRVEVLRYRLAVGADGEAPGKKAEASNHLVRHAFIRILLPAFGPRLWYPKDAKSRRKIIQVIEAAEWMLDHGASAEAIVRMAMKEYADNLTTKEEDLFTEAYTGLFDPRYKFAGRRAAVNAVNDFLEFAKRAGMVRVRKKVVLEERGGVGDGVVKSGEHGVLMSLPEAWAQLSHKSKKKVPVKHVAMMRRLIVTGRLTADGDAGSADRIYSEAEVRQQVEAYLFSELYRWEELRKRLLREREPGYEGRRTVKEYTDRVLDVTTKWRKILQDLDRSSETLHAGDPRLKAMRGDIKRWLDLVDQVTREPLVPSGVVPNVSLAARMTAAAPSSGTDLGNVDIRKFHDHTFSPASAARLTEHAGPAHRPEDLLSRAVRASELNEVRVPVLQTLAGVRLPAQFAVTGTVFGARVAVLANPIPAPVGAAEEARSGTRWSGFELRSDRTHTTTGIFAQVQITQPEHRVGALESFGSSFVSPQTSAIEDPDDILARVAAALDGGDMRYAVHDVARYWDPKAAGAPLAATEVYLKLLDSLRAAMSGHPGWRVRFTYKGVALDETFPAGWSARDQDLALVARRMLVNTRAHASEPFPATAHVIGDLNIDQANAAADDPDLLIRKKWSGAVISQNQGLRPPPAVLMAQLALSSQDPIEEGNPVIDLLRLLTGNDLSASGVNWLRRGRITRIRSVGGLKKFTILRMGARLTQRLTEAALSALEAGSSV